MLVSVSFVLLLSRSGDVSYQIRNLSEDDGNGNDNARNQ